nr:hypothetical protein [Clostridia bacterium]
VLCMGLTMTACNKATSYTIKVVYADGTPVNGLTDGTRGTSDNDEENTKIQVQICAADKETGVTGPNDFCTLPIDLGSNGVLEVTNGDLAELEDNQKWHVRLLGVKSEYTFEDLYLDGYGTYTIVLTAQN